MGFVDPGGRPARRRSALVPGVLGPHRQRSRRPSGREDRGRRLPGHGLGGGREQPRCGGAGTTPDRRGDIVAAQRPAEQGYP